MADGAPGIPTSRVIPATVDLSAKANMLPLAIYLVGAIIALIGAASMAENNDQVRARRAIAVAAAGFGLQIVGVVIFGLISLR